MSPPTREQMSNRRKIMIGGLGALTPLVLNLLVVDFEAAYGTLSAPKLLGYLTQWLVLFYVGGLWAFLHKRESEPAKVFELGIVAPAVLIGLMNGIQVGAGPEPPEIIGSRGIPPSHPALDVLVASPVPWLLVKHPSKPAVAAGLGLAIDRLRSAASVSVASIQEGSRDLHGVAVDAETRVPITDAWVIVLGAGVEARTDSVGQFSLELPMTEAQLPTLRVAALGYQSISVMSDSQLQVVAALQPAAAPPNPVETEIVAEPPEDNPVQQFLTGLFGRRKQRKTWYVIELPPEPFHSHEAAQERAQALALIGEDLEGWGDLQPRVYADERGAVAFRGSWAVGFGGELTATEAQALITRVDETGVTKVVAMRALTRLERAELNR